MKILKAAVHEFIGMFIDDGALAFLSLLLIIGFVVCSKSGYVSGLTASIGLLIGCLLVLVESVARAARAKSRSAR
jgi:hypothetical protein